MNFLTFKYFISTDALVVFYYLGAILLPVGVWILHVWLLRKYSPFNAVYEKGREMTWRALSGKQRAKVLLIIMVLFLFMELFWRMLFEFLIAYMQIRDAILKWVWPQNDVPISTPHHIG